MNSLKTTLLLGFLTGLLLIAGQALGEHGSVGDDLRHGAKQ
jgi:hypothetical protein